MHWQWKNQDEEEEWRLEGVGLGCSFTRVWLSSPEPLEEFWIYLLSWRFRLGICTLFRSEFAGKSAACKSGAGAVPKLEPADLSFACEAQASNIVA